MHILYPKEAAVKSVKYYYMLQIVVICTLKKSDLRVKPYRKCNHRCNFHLSTLFWFETEIVYQQQNAHTRIFKYAQSPTFLFALGSVRRVRVGAAGSTKDCTNNTLLFTRKKVCASRKKILQVICTFMFDLKPDPFWWDNMRAWEKICDSWATN